MHAVLSGADDFAATLLKCGAVYGPDEAALSLRQEVDARSRVEIFDYRYSAESFTRAYGMRNALKCFAALSACGIDVEEHSSVCDIGCGSGAFSVAYSHAASSDRLVLHGLDASPKQLRLARRALSLSGLPGRHSFRQRELPSSLPVEADITISSFWFCENRHVYRDAAALAAMFPGKLLVVDYREVVDDMREELAGQYQTVKSETLEVEVPLVIPDIVGQDAVTAHYALFEKLARAQVH